MYIASNNTVSSLEAILQNIQDPALQSGLQTCFTCLEKTLQAQATYNDKSEQIITNLQTENSQLQNRINRLVDNMPPTRPTSTRPRPLISDPERFSGEKETYAERQQSFRSFSAAMQEKMSVDSNCFETDDDRIYYVPPRITGDGHRLIDACCAGTYHVPSLAPICTVHRCTYIP